MAQCQKVQVKGQVLVLLAFEVGPEHLHGLAIFVALSGDEVIGYAKLVARPDGRTADHGITAVRRDWRNRGVATALKRAQIAWAKANGIDRLTAANEERNAPMQHINASLGYRRIPGRVRLRAPARRW